MRVFLKICQVFPFSYIFTLVESASNLTEDGLVMKDGCVVVASSNYPPYVYYNGTDFLGYNIQIFDILMKKLGMCYKFVRPADGFWGSPTPNGSFNGAVGLIERHEAELIPSVAVNVQRNKVMDFTDAIVYTSYSIVYPRPGLKPNYLAFLMPFNYQTWIVILATGLLLMITTIIIKKILPDIYSNVYSAARLQNVRPYNLNAMWVITALLNQPIYPSPKGTTIHVVMAFWFLVTLLFGMLYRSTLVALLLTPKIHIPFDNLEGLVNQKEIKWAFLSGSIIMSTFKPAYEEDRNSIMGKAWKWKKEMYSNVKEIPSLVADNNLACIDSTMEMISIISEDFSQTGKCRFLIANGKVLSTGIVIGVRKGSIMKQKLNPYIRRLSEAGILDKIIFGEMHNATYCKNPSTDSGRETEPKGLKLENFLGTFFFLLGGWALSLMVFICEVLVKNEKLNQWWFRGNQ